MTTTSTQSATDAAVGDDGYQQLFASSLLSLIQNAASPAASEAQQIILRRIALQGDVAPSRVPPPRNITEIGGYLNLLETLSQTDMEAQALAGILGVAGPNPPLGWISSTPALSFAYFTNDRPAGPAQRGIPVLVPVRSDFVDAVKAALASLHAKGCQVPFAGAPVALPRMSLQPGTHPDPMPYLGRTLSLMPGTALVDPATDPLVLVVVPGGSSSTCQVAAQATGASASGIAATGVQALKCSASQCQAVPLSNAKLVELGPAFATAGFYPADPLPLPTSSTDPRWTAFSNITGLIAGQSRLGDELALLYTRDAVSDSVFADALSWVFNGTTFVLPTNA